ncbi:MAG: hypothetical protein V3T17_00815 [Pseudomonadales bacterium]
MAERVHLHYRRQTRHIAGGILRSQVVNSAALKSVPFVPEVMQWQKVFAADSPTRMGEQLGSKIGP